MNEEASGTGRRRAASQALAAPETLDARGTARGSALPVPVRPVVIQARPSYGYLIGHFLRRARGGHHGAANGLAAQGGYLLRDQCTMPRSLKHFRVNGEIATEVDRTPLFGQRPCKPMLN